MIELTSESLVLECLLMPLAYPAGRNAASKTIKNNIMAGKCQYL
jgi:hypothetical protein